MFHFYNFGMEQVLYSYFHQTQIEFPTTKEEALANTGKLMLS